MNAALDLAINPVSDVLAVLLLTVAVLADSNEVS